MSGETPAGSPTLWLPNLAVLLFVALGLFADKTPLVSVRPSGSGVDLKLGETLARLWEDPLLVNEPPDLPQSHGAALREFLEEAKRNKAAALRQRPMPASVPQSARTLILPVLLPGGPYAEDGEKRLRSHHAVLSALGRAQYVPNEPDRMHFLKFQSTECPGKLETIRLQTFHVRYLVTDNVHMPGNEVYGLYASPDATSLTIPTAYDSVVVLWLDDSRLVSPPNISTSADPSLVANLESWLRILLAYPEGGDCDPHNWDLKIIGPNNSDALAALFEPALADTFKPFREATILSPRATAAPAVLQISASRQEHFEQIDLRYVGGKAGTAAAAWQVRRTIASDDQLVASLLEELKLRRAAPSDHRHMVLVGEWDSLYSRGLGRTVALKLNESVLKGKRIQSPREPWAHTPGFLHEISYLRGIDGELATGKPPAQRATESAGNPDDQAAKFATGDPERAEGRSQYDYLRRLERQLFKLERSLAASADQPKREIGSIGVIGSDPYDKLLVLRALRKSFPHAIFFTTDLDASYLERKELEQTRNLVVVSSYGLAESDFLQGRIPPFRDSYQTALFLTVLEALGVEPKDSSSTNRVIPDVIVPRVFELGRSGYTELATSLRPAGGEKYSSGHWVRWTTGLGRAMGTVVFAAGLVGLVFWRWLVITRNRHFFDPLVVFLGLCLPPFALILTCALVLPAVPGAMPVILVLFVPLLSLFSTGWSATCEVKDPRWTTGLIIGAVALLLGLLIIFFVLRPIQASPTEESFAWFQGWSIWPTEIVRTLALLVAAHFIFRCEARLRLVREHVAEVTRPVISWERPPKPLELKKRRHRLWPLNSILEDAVLEAPPHRNGWNRNPPPAANAIDVRLCKAFRSGMKWRRRSGRICLWLVLYLAVLFPFMIVLGFPAVPARGDRSFALDQGVLFASVIAYCYLLFLVIDAIVHCAVFVRRLQPCIGRATLLSDYRIVHLVNRVTEEIISMVYLPFTVLFMLVVARNSLFDNWDWPANLIAVFASGLLLLFVASAMLQHYAQEMRETALAHTNDELREALREGSPWLIPWPPAPTELAGTAAPPAAPSPARINWLKEQRAQIEAFDGVVFRPWYHNPIYRAILIPLGGLGSIQLLEQMTKAI